MNGCIFDERWRFVDGKASALDPERSKFLTLSLTVKKESSIASVFTNRDHKKSLGSALMLLLSNDGSSFLYRSISISPRWSQNC
jgi:hypothetical protein